MLRQMSRRAKMMKNQGIINGIEMSTSLNVLNILVGGGPGESMGVTIKNDSLKYNKT